MALQFASPLQCVALTCSHHMVPGMSCLVLSSLHVNSPAALPRDCCVYPQTFLEVAVKRDSGALRAFKEALADRLDTMPMLMSDAKVTKQQSMLGPHPCQTSCACQH